MEPDDEVTFRMVSSINIRPQQKGIPHIVPSSRCSVLGNPTAGEAANRPRYKEQ